MVRLKSRYVLFEIIYPPESMAEAELDRMDDVMMGFHKVLEITTRLIARQYFRRYGGLYSIISGIWGQAN